MEFSTLEANFNIYRSQSVIYNRLNHFTLNLRSRWFLIWSRLESGEKRFVVWNSFYCKILDGGFTKVASLHKSVRICFHLVESAWLSSFLLSRGRFESSTPEIVSGIFVVSFERKGMRVLPHPLNSKEKTADRDSIICSMAPWNITIILDALSLYF